MEEAIQDAKTVVELCYPKWRGEPLKLERLGQLVVAIFVGALSRICSPEEAEMISVQMGDDDVSHFILQALLTPYSK